jgi:hypothetical protein
VSVDAHPAPFKVVVLVEDALLGRKFAGTIRIEAFEHLEAKINSGFTSLDLPPLVWVEQRHDRARLVRHPLLESVLVTRMRARASGSKEWL